MVVWLSLDVRRRYKLKEQKGSQSFHRALRSGLVLLEERMHVQGAARGGLVYRGIADLTQRIHPTLDVSARSAASMELTVSEDQGPTWKLCKSWTSS